MMVCWKGKKSKKPEIKIYYQILDSGWVQFFDNSKGLKDLNWNSNWTQENSVLSTVEWWKTVTKKVLSPNEACMRDISELLDEF